MVLCSVPERWSVEKCFDRLEKPTFFIGTICSAHIIWADFNMKIQTHLPQILIVFPGVQSENQRLQITEILSVLFDELEYRENAHIEFTTRCVIGGKKIRQTFQIDIFDSFLNCFYLEISNFRFNIFEELLHHPLRLPEA